ncbi:MAG: ligase-associated DNA damage response endonuclease PdeM [Ahrensia sp.]|nr:ligase-associated DNA damage response endonuclease PdeM [Ahrensia sp.]
MRPALKSISDTHSGKAFALRFGGQNMLLDPAGVLFLQDFNALIVSDMHLEKGSSFARRGQFLPPYDTAATLDRLGALIEKYAPDIIISLGDSFHDDQGSHRLADSAINQINELAKNRRFIWVTGNHDPSPPEHLPGECANELSLAGIVLRHIANPQEKAAEISGHYHPCATISVRSKNVRRPCFACDGQRLIMPAFGVMTGGLNLADRAYHGLFNRSALRAYMQGRDQIYAIEAKNISGC